MRLRIIQLSDCHLQTDPSHDYRGINPEINLQRCLQAAADWEPDALILSGDLADHATATAYQRLNEQLAALQLPTLALPGNHDDFALLRQQLCDSVFVWQNPWLINGWQLVWLDSNLPQRPEGGLDQDKLKVLEKLDPEIPALLCLHHQPVAVGTPWIDRFKLNNPQLLWDWLGSHPHAIRAIAWGHIHHGWNGIQTIGEQTIPLFGAPATSACVMPGSEEFVLDPRGPRMRWFDLLDSGAVRSGLLSLS